MTRNEFLKSAGAATVMAAFGRGLGADALKMDGRYVELQAAIDATEAKTFGAYLMSGETKGNKALAALETAFDRVLAEVKATTVTDGRPAIWHVYNMGTVVKTREACFSIDLMHRRGHEFAPFLDFALITHNHDDHYTEPFYRAMDRAHKTVITNFKDNYGTRGTAAQGGYTRAEKTFKLKDVEVRTSLTDHNSYLVDFTTAFEIAVGGFTIYHTGDCANVAKLNPQRACPDLWIVHPRCGMKPVDGYAKFQPKRTVIAHLCELGHTKWRWTYKDGFDEAAKIRALGGEAVVPLWGDRI